MSAPPAVPYLLLCLALAACGSDSSTHVSVLVDNSIDGRDGDPNLIVDIRVIDDDEARTAPAAPAGARLEGALRSVGETQATAAQPRSELAYLALDADGAPLGIAVASGGWIGSEAVDELSGPSWSADGERLVFAGRDALHLAEPASGSTWRLTALPGAAAADWGPSLELEVDGEPRTLDVITAIGSAGSGGLEDVFAIYVDARGELAGLENLTRTPDLRELDAAWLHDGTRLAVLERSDRDALVLRDVVFGARNDLGSASPVHAELLPAGSVLREARAGALGDVSAARSRDLLTISQWTGRDWDVFCVDLRGGAERLGSAAIDESAPSWSSDDRSLALERRGPADAGAALPLAVWELAPPYRSSSCPRVTGARLLGATGALPAWRP